MAPGTNGGITSLRPMTSRIPLPADSDRALDQWVCKVLADAYGDIPDERLPEEWVDLLGPAPRE